MPISMPDPERDEDRWYPDLILEDGTQIDFKTYPALERWGRDVALYDIDRAHEAADRLRSCGRFRRGFRWLLLRRWW